MSNIGRRLSTHPELVLNPKRHRKLHGVWKRQGFDEIEEWDKGCSPLLEEREIHRGHVHIVPHRVVVQGGVHGAVDAAEADTEIEHLRARRCKNASRRVAGGSLEFRKPVKETRLRHFRENQRVDHALLEPVG